jgi:hypothetical protein
MWPACFPPSNAAMNCRRPAHRSFLTSRHWPGTVAGEAVRVGSSPCPLALTRSGYRDWMHTTSSPSHIHITVTRRPRAHTHTHTPVAAADQMRVAVLLAAKRYQTTSDDASSLAVVVSPRSQEAGVLSLRQYASAMIYVCDSMQRATRTPCCFNYKLNLQSAPQSAPLLHCHCYHDAAAVHCWHWQHCCAGAQPSITAATTKTSALPPRRKCCCGDHSASPHPGGSSRRPGAAQGRRRGRHRTCRSDHHRHRCRFEHRSSAKPR